MIGRLLCFVGLHAWWPVSIRDLPQTKWHLANVPSHVCVRCPAKRYGNRV